MLLLASGLCAYAQQNPNPNAPENFNPRSNVSPTKCASSHLIEVLPKSWCDGASFNLHLQDRQKNTTAIQWQLLDNQNNVADQGQVKPDHDPSERIKTTKPLQKGVYKLVAIELPSGCKAEAEESIEVNTWQMKILEKQDISCRSKMGRILLKIEGGKDSYWYRIEKVGEPTYCNDPYLTKNNSDCWKNLASNPQLIKLDEGKWVVHVQKEDDCEKTETVTIQNHTAPHFEKIEQLLCEATADEVPVKVTLSSSYKGNYYYSIDGAAEKKVELSPESPSFIVKVAPNKSYKIRVRDDLRCEANDVISVEGFFTAEVDEKITRNCVTNADLSFKVRIVAQKGESNTERSFHYTLLAPDKTTTQGELKEGEHLVYFSGQVGHYQIRISDKDTEACPIVKNFIVEEAKLPNIEKLQIQDEQCQERGKISISMPKNYEGYTFEMVGAIDLATRDKIIYSSHPTTKDLLSASFENLRGSVAGIQYEVEIKDSYTGCATNLIAVVKAPKPIILPAQAMQMLPYTCNSTKEAPLAQLSVDEKQIQNGVAPYTFDWFNGYNHQLVGKGTSYLLPNLNGGKFYLKVTDANGCEAHSAMQTLTPTNVLTKVEVEVLNPINCQRNEEIIINAQVQNSSDDEVPAKVTLHYIVKGNNDYKFESKSTSEQSFRLEKGNSLPVGVYTIEVVNEATGCSVKTTHTVKEPNTFALQVSDIERASCSEGKGKATLKLLNKTKGGFAGGFSYVVTSIANGAEVLRGNSQADTVTLSLVGGTYSVVVKEESLGCEVSTEVTIPENPSPLEVTATVYSSTTCDVYQSSAQVRIEGGVSPYQVTLTPRNGAAAITKAVEGKSVTFEGLEAATYEVVVTDANGCRPYEKEFSVTVAPSLILSRVSANTEEAINCQRNESVRIAVQVSPRWVEHTWLRYNIRNAEGTYNKSIRFDKGELVLNGSDALPVGVYTIEVVNEATGCTVKTTHTVKEPNTFALQVSDIERASCSEGKGKATLKLLNKTKGGFAGGFSYVVTSIANGAEVLRGNSQADTVTLSLVGGTYSVVVKEESLGCEVSTEVTIPENPSPLEVTATVYSSTTCDVYQSSAQVRIEGGVSPYQVTLTPRNGAAAITKAVEGKSVTFEGLEAATYEVVVTDANGCRPYEKEFSVTVAPSLILSRVSANTEEAINCQRNESVRIAVQVSPRWVEHTWLRYNIRNAEGTYNKSIRFDKGELVLNGSDALPVGVYTIEVVNEATGCTVKTTHTVKEPNTFALQVSDIERASCSEGKGKATLKLLNKTKGGFAGGFSYVVTSIANGAEVLRGNSQADTVTLSLVGGTYSVVVKEESLGCEVSTEVTIPENPSPLEVTATVYSSTTCDVYQSSAQVRIEGGVSPYQVTLTPRNGAAAITKAVEGKSVTFEGLEAATYEVVVTDANGCRPYEKEFSVTVAPSLILSRVSANTEEAINCQRNESVRIAVQVSPRWVEHTWLRYNIRNAEGTYNKSIRFDKGELVLNGSDALPVGVYTIEVVNEATGCTVKTTHTVKEPNTFALQVSDIERASCSEGKGKATLKLLNKTKGGFAGGFSYVVTSIANGAEVLRGNSQADTVTLSLVGGTYSVVVKEESLGCEVSTEVTIPKNPAPVKVSATAKTEADCTGANGSAEVYIQGGKSPYIVEVVNLRLSVTYRKTDLPAGVTAMTVPFNNLADGTYHVTVRDASGCAEATTQFVIAPYKSMEIANFEDSTSPITCFDSKDGRLNVSAILSGGVPPYRYILTNSTDSSVQPRTINANNGKATFENIGDGVYHLQILDSRDCTTKVIKTYSFSAPKPIKAEVDMENSVFHTCYAQRNGKIIVKNISGGTGSYKVYLITSDRKKVIDRKVGVKAGDTVEFTNIAPSQMSYEVALQDDNHCIKADLVTFRIEENPGVAMEYVERETFCDYQTESGYNDYLVVKFKNPTIDFSKVSYRLNQGNFKSFTRTLDNVAFIDDYDRSITVTQTIEISYGDPLAVNTCSVSEHNFALPVLLPYTLERIPNNELNIIEVLAKGGNTESKGYTYYFNGVNQGENPVYKVKNSDPERIESHGLRVKVVEVRVEDANGCPRTLIIEEPYSEIDVPNFFTPDGDGDNDYWRPGNLKNNPNAQIHIYDRNGRRMAILRPGQAWDGIYNGTPMPSGDYWYVIDLNDERNSEEGGKIYGHFSLYR